MPEDFDRPIQNFQHQYSSADDDDIIHSDTDRNDNDDEDDFDDGDDTDDEDWSEQVKTSKVGTKSS